jgi:hypothetical protein
MGYILLYTLYLCGRNVFGAKIYRKIKSKLYILETVVCLPQRGFKNPKLMKNELQ